MSDKGSPFQKGGGGTNFEQNIQTAFVLTLITGGNAPCIPQNEVTEVAFQTSKLGYATDDLLIHATSDLSDHKLLVQIKHHIIFSNENVIFNDVVRAFWKDFNNPAFDQRNDRLLIIKNRLNNAEKNHIKGLLNFAKTHATAKDFIAEVDQINGKKEKLEAFRMALQMANEGKPLSNDQLWQFLKCVDLLGYDFLNEGSVDLTYFLNLIKLSKSSIYTIGEREIWDSVYYQVTIYNSTGGSFNKDTIRRQDIFKYFDVSRINPVFNSVQKLKNDGELILKPLKNTINNFHIPRGLINTEIREAINNFPITIITGKPGVGKSASLKSVLVNDFQLANTFIFRADFFNQSHLASVFTNLGIQNSIEELFSCISAIPERIIVIESLEKLLEGEPENAFKQLLSIIKENTGIKIVATSRQYALELLFQKFDITLSSLKIVTVNTLSDTEINTITNQFPQLKEIIENEKIKSVLRSPKYLEFAISALSKDQGDFVDLSLIEFKNKLWNHIIEDYTVRKNGLGGKRRKAFLNIAIKRAKNMCLFVEPDSNIHDDAIEALEKDEVIFREKEEYKFSPSHDILEDWAITKYISSKFEEDSTPASFFRNIGNEPAIRRAFRLWIEDYLADDIGKVSQLIKTALEQTSIESYWADEILVAIFKSDNAAAFFEKFKTELILDQGKLFNRCIHLIRTSCRENKSINDTTSYLIPVGSGWKSIIQFIQNNINYLDLHRLSILNLLDDWGYKLMLEPDSLGIDEKNAVLSIISFFIKQIESKDKFWIDYRFMDSRYDRVIQLFLNLTPCDKDAVKELILKADNQGGKVGKWRANSFYEAVIKHILSGIYSKQVAKELSDTLIQVLERRWKVHPQKRTHTDHGFPVEPDRDECWGFNDHLPEFPPSIYRTPILFLLQYHPDLTCSFITGIINYSVNSFVKSNFRYKKEIKKVTIILSDGKEKKIYDSYELWAIYRGLSVTSYLLESILMSLEKYLLLLASYRSNWSRRKLNSLIEQLINSSSNSSIHAVIASVTMAYPTEVNKSILPIFSVKEFYRWDGMRNIREIESLAMDDQEIPFSQEERIESNQLPHRRKYANGLHGFIIDYQFNVRTLNEPLHQLFDLLKSKIKKKDIMWKKQLTEIDIRTWEVGEYNEDLKGYTFQPVYSEELLEVVNAGQEFQEIHNRAARVSNLLSKAYDGQEALSYEKWVDCYYYYTNQSEGDLLFDRPITCATVGLRDLKKYLSTDQKEWCLKTLMENISIIIQNMLNDHVFSLGMRMNIIEKEVVLNSFHLIYSNVSKKEQVDVIELIYWALVAPFPKHEVERLTKYFREVFFKEHEEAAKKVWRGLIVFSQFNKSNVYYYDDHDKKRLKSAKEKEAAFIRKLAKTSTTEILLEEVDFVRNTAYHLAKALLMLPYDINDPTAKGFILRFIELAKSDLVLKEDYSFDRSDNIRKLPHDYIFPVELYLAELLFKADPSLSKRVIDLLTESLPEHVSESETRWGDNVHFSIKIPEFAIYSLDEIVSNSDDEITNKRLIDNFWEVWMHLFQQVKINKQDHLEGILLFNIDWKPTSKSWKAFQGRKDLYYEIIEAFGFSNIKAIIKVFSSSGEDLFLPEGIIKLVELMKLSPNGTMNLIDGDGERLIKRLFHNHISKIKRDKKLLNDYVWILDEMISLGSSQAYFYRENVITYKILTI